MILLDIIDGIDKKLIYGESIDSLDDFIITLKFINNYENYNNVNENRDYLILIKDGKYYYTDGVDEYEITKGEYDKFFTDKDYISSKNIYLFS